MSALAATLALTRGTLQPRAIGDDSDSALVRRAQRGDEMAFREIVDRHKKKVFSVIWSILPRTNDAEDIAQQTFVKIYSSLGSFEYRSSLGTWVYRITVNECFDYLRKKKVRPLEYESDLGDDDLRRMDTKLRASSAEIDARIARKDIILRLLARISPEDRALLMMKEVEGYSVEELSQATGINVNTIKVRLYRIRRKLVRMADVKSC